MLSSGSSAAPRGCATLRRGAARDVTLGAVAVVLLAAAVWYFVTSSGRGDKPPTDQYVEFHCTKCNADFRLNYAEFERYFDSGKFERLADGRTLRYQCTQCGAMAADRVGHDRLGQAPPGP